MTTTTVATVAPTTQQPSATPTITVEVGEENVEIPLSCPQGKADFTMPRTGAVYSTATVRQLACIRDSSHIDDYTAGDEIESGPTVGINCADCGYDLTPPANRSENGRRIAPTPTTSGGPPAPTPRPDRWEKAAERANARARAAAPLFAFGGLVDVKTAAQMEASFDRMMAKWRVDWNACQLRLQENADRFRARVLKLKGPEYIAEMEKKRLVAPPTVEYSADHWRQVLVGLGEWP